VTPLATVTLHETGVAAYVTNSLADGEHSITAAYAGDGDFAPSTSAASVLEVSGP